MGIVEAVKNVDLTVKAGEFIISETFVSKIDVKRGVHEVDPRLVLETSVQEVPGIILDPVEQTEAIIIWW